MRRACFQQHLMSRHSGGGVSGATGGRCISSAMWLQICSRSLQHQFDSRRAVSMKTSALLHCQCA